MECYKGHSQINCMESIRAGNADVAVLDASDVYTAGLTYDLVPFISEVYNLEEPEYYVVAVGKESDPSTELTYLKSKCDIFQVKTSFGAPIRSFLHRKKIRTYSSA